MKTACVIALLLIALPAVLKAEIEWQPTPVQDAFRASLDQPGWTDDEKSDEWEEGSDEAPVSGKKSVTKAAVLSALVPGAGEYYLGNKGKARYFFAAEALTWIGFAAFRIYGGWKEDDLVQFAEVHAGARLEDKSDDFRDIVGFYDDINQYNTFGRVFDPEREYLQDTPENHWRWDSATSRETYRHLKNRSREAVRRSDFMLGVAVVTRIISVIDTIRDGRRLNSRIDSGSFSSRDKPELKVKIDPFATTSQVSVTLFTNFN